MPLAAASLKSLFLGFVEGLAEHPGAGLKQVLFGKAEKGELGGLCSVLNSS